MIDPSKKDHFPLALAEVFYREGVQTRDQGGETMYGITVACLRDIPKELADLDLDGDVDEMDVRLVDMEKSELIYRHLWDKWGMDRILVTPVAVKLFSLAINSGFVQATKVLQRAIYACAQPIGGSSHLKDGKVEFEFYDLSKSRKGNDFDGVLGQETLDAIGPAWDGGGLMPAFRSEWAGFARGLVAKDPARHGNSLDGWLKRAYDRPY